MADPRTRRFRAIAIAAAVALTVAAGLAHITSNGNDAGRRPSPTIQTAGGSLPSLADAPSEPMWTFDVPDAQYGPSLVGGDADRILAYYSLGPERAQLRMLDPATGIANRTIVLPDDVTSVSHCALLGPRAACVLVLYGSGQRLAFIDLDSVEVIAQGPEVGGLDVAAVDNGFLAWSDGAPPVAYRPDGTEAWAATGGAATVVPEAGLVLSITDPSLPANSNTLVDGEARVIDIADGRLLTRQAITHEMADPEFQALRDGRFVLRGSFEPVGVYSSTGEKLCSTGRYPDMRLRWDQGTAGAVPVTVRPAPGGASISALDTDSCEPAWTVDLPIEPAELTLRAVDGWVIATNSEDDTQVAISAATGEFGYLPDCDILGSDGQIFAAIDTPSNRLAAYRPSADPTQIERVWQGAENNDRVMAFGGGLYAIGFESLGRIL